MPAKISLIGQTFGRLKVIADAPPYVKPSGHKEAKSVCLCTCGKTTSVHNQSLRSGDTKSCGCFYRESRHTVNLTHGMSKTRIWKLWRAMRERCEWPKNKKFSSYGGRGIKVCKRWSSFACFLSDMGEGKKGWTLERINNNGNYEPKNLCWAQRIPQARNTRTNRIATVRGITACMAELCERFKVSYPIVMNRIYNGWPIERAFFEPVHRSNGQGLAKLVKKSDLNLLGKG